MKTGPMVVATLGDWAKRPGELVTDIRVHGRIGATYIGFRKPRRLKLGRGQRRNRRPSNVRRLMMGPWRVLTNASLRGDRAVLAETGSAVVRESEHGW